MKTLLLAVLLSVTVTAQPTPRHASAVRQFEKLSGYPHGRAGFVVDHVRPLCFGGADAPSNMQWEERAESLLKDADERRLCAVWRRFEQKWITKQP